MFAALSSLLTDALAGDFGAFLLLVPFVVAPTAVLALMVEALYPYNCRMGKRTYEPTWGLVLVALPVFAFMGGCLGMILSTTATYA